MALHTVGIQYQWSLHDSYRSGPCNHNGEGAEEGEDQLVRTFHGLIRSDSVRCNGILLRLVASAGLGCPAVSRSSTGILQVGQTFASTCPSPEQTE